MQQDALDDAHLLRLLRHLDDAAVRVAAIVAVGQLSPPLVGVVFQFLLVEVLVEHLDGTATHGDGDDAHPLIGKFLDHRAAEIVAGPQFSHRADDGALGCVPVAERSLGVVEVAGGQHLEARVHVAHVLRFPLGVAFHVRLSETNVDVEVRVCLAVRALQGGRQQSDA